jgi:hypothetical protein
MRYFILPKDTRDKKQTFSQGWTIGKEIKCGLRRCSENNIALPKNV